MTPLKCHEMPCHAELGSVSPGCHAEFISASDCVLSFHFRELHGVKIRSFQIPEQVRDDGTRIRCGTEVRFYFNKNGALFNSRK